MKESGRDKDSDDEREQLILCEILKYELTKENKHHKIWFKTYFSPLSTNALSLLS